MTTPFTLALTPAGHLHLRPADDGEPAPDPAVARRIAAAFERGPGAGLLHLGAAEARTALPPVLGFWRDLGRAFVAALCALPDLEDARGEAAPSPRDGELEALAAAAPPLPGGEYLSPAVLLALWGELAAAYRAALEAHAGTVQAWLAARDPAWSVVGRVHLHLAENRRDEEHPFAFLATYTTGLTASGKPQHRPLGDAVRETTASDRKRLLAVLQPVQKAAEKSPLVKALADSGRIFQPQAWTPAEAHQFLREVPALEESGVVRTKGLFPATAELDLSCSCPDGAWLCKHLAAVLYGVGARLDRAPELLFTLRGVDGAELVAAAGSTKALGAEAPAGAALAAGDLGAIFGIELEGSGAPYATASRKRKPKAPAARKPVRAKAKAKGRRVKR